MAKKVKSNTVSSQPPKQWNRLLGYNWNEKEPHEDALKDLANRQRLWAQKEDSLRLEDFLDEENVPSSSYYLWKDRYAVLQEAHAYTLRRLASRRYNLAFSKKADPNIFKLDQHLYDERWEKEVNQYWAALRKTDEQAPSKIQVEVIQYPSIDTVPKKKDTKE